MSRTVDGYCIDFNKLDRITPGFCYRAAKHSAKSYGDYLVLLPYYCRLSVSRIIYCNGLLFSFGFFEVIVWAFLDDHRYYYIIFFSLPVPFPNLEPAFPPFRL